MARQSKVFNIDLGEGDLLTVTARAPGARAMVAMEAEPAWRPIRDMIKTNAQRAQFEQTIERRRQAKIVGEDQRRQNQAAIAELERKIGALESVPDLYPMALMEAAVRICTDFPQDRLEDLPLDALKTMGEWLLPFLLPTESTSDGACAPSP